MHRCNKKLVLWVVVLQGLYFGKVWSMKLWNMESHLIQTCLLIIIQHIMEWWLLILQGFIDKTNIEINFSCKIVVCVVCVLFLYVWVFTLKTKYAQRRRGPPNNIILKHWCLFICEVVRHASKKMCLYLKQTDLQISFSLDNMSNNSQFYFYFCVLNKITPRLRYQHFYNIILIFSAKLNVATQLVHEYTTFWKNYTKSMKHDKCVVSDVTI